MLSVGRALLPKGEAEAQAVPLKEPLPVLVPPRVAVRGGVAELLRVPRGETLTAAEGEGE